MPVLPSIITLLCIAEEWNKGNYLPIDPQTHSIANRVSYFLDLNGPSFVVDTACSSSLVAIHLACESIRRGECQMAFAGGVNLSIHPSKYHLLGNFGFMSEEGKCVSFGANGTGYVPGEGVGTILLKPLSLAKRDRDHIYGVIKSTSMNHGGKTAGYTVPNPNAQAELIKEALVKANINARTISYVEAHGTGTSLGDPIEIRGLQEAFENDTPDKQFCAIGSVKSNIGHLEAAAGISQITKVLLQMKYRKLVPSLHADELNPFIDFVHSPFYVQRELTEWKVPANQPLRAGISSFGAGGTNVHVILEEFIMPDRTMQTIICPYLFVLSAQNPERLKESANNMLSFLKEEKFVIAEQDLDNWLTQICYTLQTGREPMAVRLAILSENYNDLLLKLNQYLNETQAVSDIWLGSEICPNKNEHLPDLSFQSEEINSSKNFGKLAKAWVNGAKISWEECYKDQKISRISLPTYPFEKRYCWVTSTETKKNKPIDKIEKPSINPGTTYDEKLIYTLHWKEKDESKDHSVAKNEGISLIFSDFQLGFHLQKELGNLNIMCFANKDFLQISKNVFYLNPLIKDHYEQFFQIINKEHNIKLKNVVILSEFIPPAEIAIRD